MLTATLKRKSRFLLCITDAVPWNLDSISIIKSVLNSDLTEQDSIFIGLDRSDDKIWICYVQDICQEIMTNTYVSVDMIDEKYATNAYDAICHMSSA